MAASDLANLFGLNNKQESMDTARIASFEPGTFKPIMAGPEVAQGVAAGLFNMGNAVFGAFDNKVKETSRDDTAYATNEFLNTLQTAASMATPDELPTVIQTFSQVLDENPSILQDKGRTALNELSAQVTKNKELQATKELKYAELAQQAAADQAKRALEIEELKLKQQELVLKQGETKNPRIDQQMKVEVDALDKVKNQEKEYWVNNESTIRDLTRNIFLTRIKDTPGLTKESAKGVLDNILSEVTSGLNVSTTAEQREKTLTAIYSSIFNDKAYEKATINNSEKIRQMDLDKQVAVSSMLSSFTSKLGSAISGTPGKQEDTKRGLNIIAGYIAGVTPLTTYQKGIVGSSEGTNIVTLLSQLGVPTIWSQGFVNALAGSGNVSSEKFQKLFKGIQEVIADVGDDESKWNSKTAPEKAEAFRKAFRDATGITDEGVVKGFSNIFELLVNPTARRIFAAQEQKLNIELNRLNNDKDNFMTTAVLNLAHGGMDSTVRQGLIDQQQSNLATARQTIQNERALHERAISKLYAYGSVYTPNISETSTTNPIVIQKLNTLNARSSGMLEVASSPMVTSRATFDYLLENSARFSNTVAQINQLLPEGMDIYDLLVAEAFVPGMYKDGGTNVAIGFGNNIRANKDLQNKIRRFQNSRNWAAILDDPEFNEAIYSSVKSEGQKVIKKWGNIDPAQIIIDNLDEKSKTYYYNELTPDQQLAVKKNINAYEFLAKYRGESGLRKSGKYNLGDITAQIKSNRMKKRYSRFYDLTTIVPVK